jgi:hypothetical protein
VVYSTLWISVTRFGNNRLKGESVMSGKKGEMHERVKIENLVVGDVIGGVVGKKGRVRIDRLEVVKGDKVRLFWGDNTVTEIDADDPFCEIYHRIDSKPKDKKKLAREVEQIRQEVQKGEDAHQGSLQERLKNLAKMAPDIFEVTIATLANPALGFALVVQKIAKKAREEYAQQSAGA